MSTVAPPRPAPAPAPVPPATWTRQPTRRRLLTLGAAIIALLLAIPALIFSSFSGAFSSYVVVRAELPDNSTAVSLNAPVEYRNITVGTVASQGTVVSGGAIELTLDIKPSMMSHIPAGVQASETPVSFFGDPYIVLQPPASTTSTASLRPGAVIPALSHGQTASLQSTLGDLDTLLLGLHPAQLDAALTAVAQAIEGQGTSLGHNLVRGNAYFSQMLKLWPTVVSDLKMLVPVSDQFAASSNNILAILSNQTTTGATINSQASEVRQALSGGATVSGQLSQILTAIQQPYDILAADSGPFLKDVAQSPTEISQLLSGLDNWAKAWTTAEASGPYLSLTTTVTVANPADLGLAVLGGPEMTQYLSDGLGAGRVNPPTYSSAGSIPPTAAAEQAAQALGKTLAEAPSPVMPPAQETRSVSEIVTAMTGSAPSSPAVASLLLSPLLSGLVGSR